jgi:hypothetical protein
MPSAPLEDNRGPQRLTGTVAVLRVTQSPVAQELPVPPVTLRPRSTTELIDAAVQLLRQHYVELVAVTALFMIPVIIARLVFVPVQIVTPSQILSASTLRGFGLLYPISFIFSSVSTAATVVIVSDSYLGREVTIEAAVSRVLARFWTVLGAAFLEGLIIVFGFVLLIVPGIIFACWLFATTNVVMVEDKSAFDALARSRNLARGSVGKILAVLLFSILIVWLLQLLIGFVLGLLVAGLRPGNPSLAGQLVGYAVAILLYPFVQVVITLLYYDLRIRKEGFDMELMAKELGFAPPAQATA